MGGHFNNFVACNEQIGTWPRLAQNLSEAFMMPEFWLTLERVYQHKTPEAQLAALLELSHWVKVNRPFKSRIINASGIVHTSMGFPVRLGSSGYSQVFKALAWARGNPFTGIKQ